MGRQRGRQLQLERRVVQQVREGLPRQANRRSPADLPGRRGGRVHRSRLWPDAQSPDDRGEPRHAVPGASVGGGDVAGGSRQGPGGNAQDRLQRLQQDPGSFHDPAVAQQCQRRRSHPGATPGEEARSGGRPLARGYLPREGRYPPQPAQLLEVRDDVSAVSRLRRLRSQLPLRPVPIPASPEDLRGDPHQGGHGIESGPGGAVAARRLPVSGAEGRGPGCRRARAALPLLPEHRVVPGDGRQADHRSGQGQPEPQALRQRDSAGLVPDPLRRRDEGEHRQPHHALHRQNRCRSDRPQTADRGVAGPS